MKMNKKRIIKIMQMTNNKNKEMRFKITML